MQVGRRERCNVIRLQLAGIQFFFNAILMNNTGAYFSLEQHDSYVLLQVTSADGTNRLTRACVLQLTQAVRALAG